MSGPERRSLSYLAQISSPDLRVVSHALGMVNHSHSDDADHEKIPPICMREILSTGYNSLIEFSLKHLLCLVNSASDHIDAKRNSLICDKPFASVPEIDFNNVEFMKATSARRNHDMLHQGNAQNILARDIRRLDFDSHPNEEPSIRVRKHVVIFVIDPIRAIIMSSRIIIIVPPGGMDQILEIVEKYMRGWTKEQVHFLRDSDVGHISFESHAFEAILATTNTLNSQEFRVLNLQAENILTYFQTKLSAILPYTIQEKMRHLKNDVSRLQAKIFSLQKILKVLIEDDETMALMNLSKLRANPDVYRDPLSHDFMSTHEEIEELLESHLMDCNSLGEKISYLLVTIQNSEDLMMLKLDTSRNQLLVLNTRLVVFSVAIGFSAYFTGIFGMNLDNTVTIQTVVFGVFEAVTVGSFALIFITSASLLYYLKRVNILPRLLAFRD